VTTAETYHEILHKSVEESLIFQNVRINANTTPRNFNLPLKNIL